MANSMPERRARPSAPAQPASAQYLVPRARSLARRATARPPCPRTRHHRQSLPQTSDVNPSRSPQRQTCRGQKSSCINSLHFPSPSSILYPPSSILYHPPHGLVRLVLPLGDPSLRL